MKRLLLVALVFAPFGVLMARRADLPHDHERVFRPRETYRGEARGPHGRHHRVVRVTSDGEEPAQPEWADVVGYAGATPERALEGARRRLDETVHEWLGPVGVPDSWTPPQHILDSMVETHGIDPIAKDYGVDGRVYVQTLRLDRSNHQRDRLIEAFERELAGRRLVSLGGALAFLLVCLASLTGYIRADEATRGYYTAPLRLIAAVGVGATGVVLYRLLA